MDGNQNPLFPAVAVGVAAFAIACAGTASFTQPGTVAVAIDKMAIGMAPVDFEFSRTGQGEPGTWTVAADATAVGSRAIEQTSTDATDFRFPLAIYKPLSAHNVDVTIRFKALSGKVDRAGGVAVRLRDPDNYYVVRANALEDDVRFYRVVKGRREQLKSAGARVTANEWHTLSLRADGERFTVTFDGSRLFTASDRTLSTAGRIALWTKADSVTRFDRIEIKTLP